MPQSTPHDQHKKAQIVDALNRLQTLLAETIDEQHPTIQNRFSMKTEIRETGHRYMAFETEITILRDEDEDAQEL